MENEKMMEKLQKSLRVNRCINLILMALMICLLVGGYILYNKIIPVISAVQDIRITLKYVEQIDYEALNQTIEALDVEGLNEKLEQLDVEAMNEALNGLDTEELTEALENLNNAVDKLEKIGKGLNVAAEWFKDKFNF